MLPAVISEDMAWSIGGLPYFITQDLLIEPGVVVTVQHMVEVRLAEGVSIVVQGQLMAMGNQYYPIRFRPDLGVDRWGALCFESASGPSTLSYVEIEGASAGSGLAWRRAAVSSHESDLILEHVTFTGNWMCVYLQDADFQADDCVVLGDNLAEHINVRN